MFIFLLNMPINRFLCYIIEWFVLARYIQLANVVMAKFPPPPTTVATGYRGHLRISLSVFLDKDLRFVKTELLKKNADLAGLCELRRGNNGRLR